MALRGTLLILTGISWLTAIVSEQGQSPRLPSSPTGPKELPSPTGTKEPPTEPPSTQEPTKAMMCSISWSCGITEELCNLTEVNCQNHKLLKAKIDLEYQEGIIRTIRYNCNRTMCINSISLERCPVETSTAVTTSKTYITTTPSSSSPTAGNTSTPLGATHGGYIVVILVLLAIIITLVVLVGYLVRRTTAQRGTVQTTEQPPPDMAATAGDYCEPIALRQLQTSTEPVVYSEPADTLNRLHSASNRQGTPSCHVNPSYEGAPSCQVNPSYEGTPVTNGHSVLQQPPPSHPPLPDPPTDDSNTEYSKPVEMDNLPPLAENDYEVLEEVRREKEKSPEKLE